MRIPIILVTGFLGSGKTTFLRQVATLYPNKHWLFLVNEFSETGVDEESLAITRQPVQSVVGGSLFCECKAGEFVRVMRERVLQEHRQLPLDAVVIETSGIADPQAMGVLMRDHGLNKHFSVQQIVAIVAPQRFPTLHAHLPSVRAQILTSHLVILNKIDIATAEEIMRTETIIRDANPVASIVSAEHCLIEFPLKYCAPKLHRSELSSCESNPFSTVTVSFEKALALRDIEAWLYKLPAEILRVKGSILTERGWFEVQKTVETAELSETQVQSNSALVIIAHDDEEETLEIAASQLNQL